MRLDHVVHLWLRNMFTEDSRLMLPVTPPDANVMMLTTVAEVVAAAYCHQK